MPHTATAPKSESIATRHARLYDRRTKHNMSESLIRFATSILVVGVLAISLWFVAG